MRLLVVGNGAAGKTVADKVRTANPDLEITIISDEGERFYIRPALSTFLAGKIPEEKVYGVPINYYSDRNINLLHGCVVGVDENTVHLKDGVVLPFDFLCLSPGANPNTLRCPGANLPEVCTLRTFDQARALSSGLEKPLRVVVVGGGIQGIEMAEAARARGSMVTLLVREERIGIPTLDENQARERSAKLIANGVDLRLGQLVNAVVGTDHVTGVETTLGEVIPCQQVWLAIGVTPATEFLIGSGLALRLRIATDPDLETRIPNIFAAGDAAEVPEEVANTLQGLTPWMRAIRQGERVANTIIARQMPAS